MAGRAERRRQTREARHLSLVPEFDQGYGVVGGWFQDESDLEAAKKQSHDILIRLMGDARVGGVQWRWWTGDRAKEVLGTLHRGDNSPEMSDHLRRIGAHLREYGGYLIIAMAEGRMPEQAAH